MIANFSWFLNIAWEPKFLTPIYSLNFHDFFKASFLPKCPTFFLLLHRELTIILPAQERELKPSNKKCLPGLKIQADLSLYPFSHSSFLINQRGFAYSYLNLIHPNLPTFFEMMETWHFSLSWILSFSNGSSVLALKHCGCFLSSLFLGASKWTMSLESHTFVEFPLLSALGLFWSMAH